MNTTLLHTASVTLMLLAGTLFPGFAQEDFRITPEAAGKVRIGMTVSEARKAMPGHKFERTTDGEGLALIAVSKGGDAELVLYAGEDDPEAALKENGKIEHIEVFSGKYKTPEGISAGMKISDAEKLLGKVLEIRISEIEAREFATFTRQPGEVAIRLLGKRGMAGVYAEGKQITTRYSPDAYILSLSISGRPEVEGFASRYTDLGTDCRSEEMGEEAQHSSAYCNGYGGYRVHIFDSATTLEIRVASEDGTFSVPVASQSLSYELKGRKLEWRMKDGVPFAVILRGYTYERGEDGLIKYPEKTTGEFLFVRGLEGSERISEDISVDTPANANELARAVADARYSMTATKFAEYLSVGDFNREIREAAAKNEGWARSAMQVVMKLSGEFSEIRRRTIDVEAPWAEGADELKVTVTDDGILDDSVRGEKTVFMLKRDAAGVWMVQSAYRSQRCWENRGHQEYSAEPCI